MTLAGRHDAVTDFFSLLDRLLESSALTVDRKRGSPHPRINEAICPVDDDHLDGAEIDVFVGGARGHGVVGALLTADLQKRDAEIKILVNCTTDEVRMARQFCAVVLGIGGHLVKRPAQDPSLPATSSTSKAQ